MRSIGSPPRAAAKTLSDGGWGRAVYAAADAGACTEAEAARLVRSFLSAGVDTTVNGIGHLILALATPPRRMDRAPRRFPAGEARIRGKPALGFDRPDFLPHDDARG